MNKKFQILCLDPAWSFSDKLSQSNVKRGALANYSTMPIDDIKALPISQIADPEGAILCLWVPSSLLKEGIEVMECFKFNLKQTYIWNKIKQEPLAKLKELFKRQLKFSNLKSFNMSDIRNYLDLAIKSYSLNNSMAFGMGRLFRNCHEICLIGTNNNKIYKSLVNKSQRSVSFAENKKHSSKPENLYQSLDRMFPNANGKIEFFARRQRKDWVCLGNEAPMTYGEDIVFSLNKLISADNQVLIDDLDNEINNYSGDDLTLNNKWRLL